MPAAADPFVAQLKQLCASFPTRAKWVLVPTHAIGRTLADRLVLEGTDWANLHFVTPYDVALRMGAPFLVEQGIDPSEDQLGPALIMRLLMGLSGEPGYFKPLAHEPLMAMALWSTLRELRAAGLRAADLKADAFESASKHAELRALVEAYEAHLATNKLGDQATIYEEALAHADWCPIRPKDCWTSLPSVVWTPLQQRLFATIPGEHLGTAHPVTQHPDTGNLVTGHPVSFFQSGGPEAEVEEVFRRILASGRSLDQVEIACAAEGYATLIWEKACHYEWPVTLATGLPATLTRPGRALLGLTEWVEDKFASGRLRRLLQSGDVSFSEGSTLSPARAARLLVKAEAAWGRDTYRFSLGRLATSARKRATDDLPDDEREILLRRAAEADELAAWIGDVIAAVPEPGIDGLVDLQTLVGGAARFVEASAARASALDHAAAKRLVLAIRELKALGEFRCSLNQALRFLRGRVESLHVGADRSRPGHLHVSRLREAAFAARPIFFVVGLEEGRVFPAAIEDPVLLDTERARLNAELRLSTSRIDEAVRSTLDRLESAMASPSIAVTVSYSCRDLRQFRATYASWVMLHVFRTAMGQPAATYKDLHEHLGAPVSSVPASAEQALGAGRWWLYGAARGGEVAGRTAVLRAFDPLQHGVNAEAARDGNVFTEFDGYVPAAGAVLDPTKTGRIVSPTQLEDAAKCPFQYFLRRGLGLDAIDSGERERDVWLNPLIRGSMLHDLYAALLRRCRDEERAPKLPDDDEWLQAEGKALLARTALEMPPPSDEVRERETTEFLADLEIFVIAEAAMADNRTPVALEVGFGRSGGDDDNAEPLDQPEPIVIEAGGLTFTVAGRIDRIDRIGEPGAATFEIIDYKTGGYWEADWKGTFAGGRRLQHALYGLAAAELLRRRYKKAKVTGAQYYFSSTKGRQHRKVIPAPTIAKVGEVLNDLREVIASGLYIHAPDERDCSFCDYGDACGPRVQERAKAKLLIDAKLAPYRRLNERI